MKFIVKEKFWHMGEDSQILDANEQPAYEVDGKVFTIHDLIIVNDLQGNEVARVSKKLIALKQTFHVDIRGATVATITKHMFTFLRQKFTIALAQGEYEMDGNLTSHEFTIANGNDVVATVSKQWFALTDTYGVEIADGEDVVTILSCVLALDLAMDDERHD